MNEYLRPWKLITFSIGMAWLLYGAVNYHISDWDIGISLIMGFGSYFFAPYSMAVLTNFYGDRNDHPVRKIILALALYIFTVDTAYWIYHTLMGNVMYRHENFIASTCLYFLTGAIWLHRGSLKDLLRPVIKQK
jgi:hypothetical protein